jgi:hypothetical protein
MSRCCKPSAPPRAAFAEELQQRGDYSRMLYVNGLALVYWKAGWGLCA